MNAHARRGKTKEGFLYVKQPSRFGKAWKRKWVVIRPNTTKGSEQSSVVLELYLEKGAYNKTVNSVLLEGISSIKRVLSKSQPRAFEFVKASNDAVAITLAGDNETDTQEWIEVFRKLLLPAAEQKELNSIQGYGKDIIRLGVVPNKDSVRLKLSGHYLAGVSRLQVTLHNPITGEKVLEWDLRHIKRFMLPSKGPQQDLEKIACLQISNRSPQGEGEYLFFSPKAKQFVESIYERLSTAITVKERRSRTSSMLFEIPPKELEQLAKAIQDGGDPGFVMVGADGSVDDDTFENGGQIENGDAKPNGDANSSSNGSVDVKVNGDAKENHVGATNVEESKENGKSEDHSDAGGQSNKQETEESIDAKATTVTQGGDKQEDIGASEQTAEKENSTDEASEDAKAENGSATTTQTASEENDSKSDVKDSSTESAQAGDESEEKVNGTQNETTQATDEILDESTKVESAEKQDVATEPIDADEGEADVSGSVSDVAPRMPPDTAELEQENDTPQDKETSTQEAERTESSDDSANRIPSEQIGEQTDETPSTENKEPTSLAENKEIQQQNTDKGLESDNKVEPASTGDTKQKANTGAEESSEIESTPTPAGEGEEKADTVAAAEVINQEAPEPSTANADTITESTEEEPEKKTPESKDESPDLTDATDDAPPAKEEPEKQEPESKEEERTDQTDATKDAPTAEKSSQEEDKSPEPTPSPEEEPKVPDEVISTAESSDAPASQEKPQQRQEEPSTEETEKPTEEPTQPAETNDSPQKEKQQAVPSTEESSQSPTSSDSQEVVTPSKVEGQSEGQEKEEETEGESKNVSEEDTNL